MTMIEAHYEFRTTFSDFDINKLEANTPNISLFCTDQTMTCVQSTFGPNNDS